MITPVCQLGACLQHPGTPRRGVEGHAVLQGLGGLHTVESAVLLDLASVKEGAHGLQVAPELRDARLAHAQTPHRGLPAAADPENGSTAGDVLQPGDGIDQHRRMANRSGGDPVCQDETLGISSRESEGHEGVGGEPGVPDPEGVKAVALRRSGVLHDVGSRLRRIYAGHDAELGHVGSRELGLR